MSKNLNTSKHTPAPWISQVVDTGKQEVYIISGKEEPTAFARITNKADANLIAAAPELLEALKEFLLIDTWTDEEIASFELVKNAKAAIAKAEGR